MTQQEQAVRRARHSAIRAEVAAEEIEAVDDEVAQDH